MGIEAYKEKKYLTGEVNEKVIELS